eukprot:COSAG01_NODE_69016_length_262_cov_1.257669_1_plen_21_part_01
MEWVKKTIDFRHSKGGAYWKV